MGIYCDYVFYPNPESEGVYLGDDISVSNMVRFQDNKRVISKNEFLKKCDKVACSEIVDGSFLHETYLDTYGDDGGFRGGESRIFFVEH